MSVEGPASLPENATPYDHLVAQTRKQHRLFSVHWELTYRCNQKCSHCYLDVCSPASPALDELIVRCCVFGEKRGTFDGHCESSESVRQWVSGTVGQWVSETVGQWDSGSVGQWDSGSVRQWDSGTVGQ